MNTMKEKAKEPTGKEMVFRWSGRALSLASGMEPITVYASYSLLARCLVGTCLTVVKEFYR